MSDTVSQRLLDRFTRAFATFREYFGIGGKVRKEPIESAEALRQFITTRASFIAQTSLYGYLRTRAGQRYPELFESDAFVDSINIAKWHMWLACLSDLSVYAGGLLAHATDLSDESVGDATLALLDQTMTETGTPPEADDEFPDHAQRVRQRVALTDWRAVGDGEACFQASPDALVRWAPIIRDLMDLDEPIVRNSVRFHWQEIRHELRTYLRVDAVAGDIAGRTR